MKLKEIYDELKNIPPEELPHLTDETYKRFETESFKLRKILDSQFDSLNAEQHLGNITFCMEYLIKATIMFQIDTPQLASLLITLGSNLSTVICGAMMVEQYKAKQIIEINELKRMFES